MQISVTVEANAKGASELIALADILRVTTGKPAKAVPVEVETEAEAEAPKRRGRPKKTEAEAEAPKRRGRKKKSEEIEDEDDAEEIEEDEGEDDAEEIEEDEGEEDADDEEDEEDEFISPDELKKLKSALRAHSEKHGKQSAVKNLMKFARVSQDVKKTDLPKLLKLLKK